MLEQNSRCQSSHLHHRNLPFVTVYFEALRIGRMYRQARYQACSKQGREHC